jgi:uncharacterized protein (TIGR02722 family)
MTVVFSFLLSACALDAGRDDKATGTDQAGNWSDTDSRLAAEQMASKVLSGKWLNNYNQAGDKKPTVIVGTVRNLSREQLDTSSFIVEIERELMASGKIGYIASSSKREELREMIREQDSHATDASRKSLGEKTGADYMLKGSINSLVDAISGEQVLFYQIDLTLIELATNRNVWTGKQKIRKVIDKPV